MSESIDQSDFPSSWSRDCPSKGMKVEISTFDVTEIIQGQFSETGIDWIEIPTSNVELWETRGDGPHIKKEAKITFPTEWDGADVRSAVQGFGNDPITFGRVSVKDSSGTWVLDHCGVIAGVGGTENSLESKAWIHDMTYVFDAIGITASYSLPTIGNVLTDVGNRIGDTYIPLVDIAILPPDSEAFFLKELGAIADAEQRSGSSYYGYDTSADDSQLGDVELRNIEVDTGVDVPFSDLLTLNVDDILLQELGIEQSFRRKVLGAGIDWLYQNTPLGNKDFTRNHNDVGDVLNWLAQKTGIQWHFEPVQNGVVLVITSGPMRRTFVQDAVRSDLQSGDIEPSSFQTDDEYEAHDEITVRSNQALYEIAPANTVLVTGDTRRSLLEGNTSFGGTLESVPVVFEDDEYPVAKARAVPLVEAAGGQELPLEVDSDASTVNEARQVAVNALQNHLNQSSEGNIVLDGSPRMLPYDVVDAYETCQDYVTEQIPVRYEIEQVKHTDSMTSTLETTLNVQAFVGEEQIEFVADETGIRDI